ncbi:MAG: T9SS type A sorting domain-containing protein, partial [Lentisphaeria bacterium]|nr:T9SS type A sorting domain-containing protein [Lentisphaeria bacterium]
NNGGTSDDYEHVALLGDGLIAEQDAEYGVAIDYYQQFLDSDPPNKDQMIAALSGMDRCYGHLKAVDQWQVQLEAIAANFDKQEQQKLAQNYLIWVYKKLGLDAEAIAAAQSLIDDCSDPEYVDYYTLEIALLLYETDGSILAKTSPEQRQVADRIQLAQHHLLTTDNQTEAAQLYQLLTGGSGRVASGAVVPDAYALHPAYPNPFNPITTIRYDLPEAGRIRVAVYDIRGRLVTTLTNEDKQPGSYQVQWQGKDASGRMVGSGLYFYTLEAVAYGTNQTFRSSRKMLLMK